MATFWPSSIFHGHFGEHVDDRSLEMMFDACSLKKCRIKFTRYTISDRPEKHWLVAAMRLPLLWEHDGPETVVSIDIHDDIKVQNRQIDKLLNKLKNNPNPNHRNKEVAMTYWAAREHECSNGTNIPHGRHNHMDAGLCLWQPGQAREVAKKVGNFVRYCCAILDGTFKVKCSRLCHYTSL